MNFLVNMQMLICIVMHMDFLVGMMINLIHLNIRQLEILHILPIRPIHPIQILITLIHLNTHRIEIIKSK
jgi:hypothetical protein